MQKIEKAYTNVCILTISGACRGHYYSGGDRSTTAKLSKFDKSNNSFVNSLFSSSYQLVIVTATKRVFSDLWTGARKAVYLCQNTAQTWH